jgi:hypothetical protein
MKCFDRVKIIATGETGFIVEIYGVNDCFMYQIYPMMKFYLADEVMLFEPN